MSIHYGACVSGNVYNILTDLFNKEIFKKILTLYIIETDKHGRTTVCAQIGERKGYAYGIFNKKEIIFCIGNEDAGKRDCTGKKSWGKTKSREGERV